MTCIICKRSQLIERDMWASSPRKDLARGIQNSFSDGNDLDVNGPQGSCLTARRWTGPCVNSLCRCCNCVTAHDCACSRTRPCTINYSKLCGSRIAVTLPGVAADAGHGKHHMTADNASPGCSFGNGSRGQQHPSGALVDFCDVKE